ncbi:MAG: AAA family ATPase [Candidatus Omnitrophica bacterium]|nr:AAA family ATPase [Candidatus Omnitrophota bacterium]
MSEKSFSVLKNEKLQSILNNNDSSGSTDSAENESHHGSADAMCDLPKPPGTFEEAGLSSAFVQDLAIKHLYRNSVLTGREIANLLHLPYPLMEPVLEKMIEMTYAEKRGGQGLGGSVDRFSLTERGKAQARDLLLIDTYVGPAPVPLNHYADYVQKHNVKSLDIDEDLLRYAWRDFILDESLFSQVGPAICSGKSCFLYGPPGTGKTTIAKMIARLLDEKVGGVAIPHAVIVGDSIVRLYDPIYHRAINTFKNKTSKSGLFDFNQHDRRWAPCHRPCVIVGGDLMLDMLDLRYNATSKFYEAPLQMKANGGIFIIDDFGRQMVKPCDLLNRWIVPLENRIDFLTLHTGKKFSVPFEQLVVFATNLDPNDLADEAFLRRIRYKIFIGEPSIEAYKSIFDDECKKKELQYDAGDLDFIIQKFYKGGKRPLRACDPRDMTDLIVDYCKFNSLPRRIERDIFDMIATDYMRDLQSVGNKPSKDFKESEAKNYQQTLSASA